MQRARRVPVVLFVVCLVAAMPFAWSAGSLGDLNDNASASLKVTVTLCHVPFGNPANARTITVGQAAVASHLAHGDYLGDCHPACAGIPAPVPKTGQSQCWDQNGTEIDCAGTGQDGQLKKGASVSPRFADIGDGTVRDNLTGLVWLKDVNCLGQHDWTGALLAANALASGACSLTDGSVAGDWRLPNVKELESLIDFGQTPALPAGHPFAPLDAWYYWSSTSVPFNPPYAWSVSLYSGYVDGNFHKSVPVWVWPVRGGQ